MIGVGLDCSNQTLWDNSEGRERERGIGIERKGERGKPRKSIDSHNKIDEPNSKRASNVMRETIEVSIKK